MLKAPIDLLARATLDPIHIGSLTAEDCSC